MPTGATIYPVPLANFFVSLKPPGVAISMLLTQVAELSFSLLKCLF